MIRNAIRLNFDHFWIFFWLVPDFRIIDNCFALNSKPQPDRPTPLAKTFRTLPWRSLSKLPSFVRSEVNIELAKNPQHFFAIELLNFRFFFIFSVEFCIFSANFLWNFVRISRQISEKSDVCRFFNQICENKLENCRKFWNLWKLFIIIHSCP